jgi:hypothetical protein
MRFFGFILTLALAAPAHADVFTLTGDLHGGGMFGKGTSGDEAVSDQAFFARIPNLTYGASVGARFLFLGATITHHQYAGPRIDEGMSVDKPSLATWTQLVVGVDFTVDLGSDHTEPGGPKSGAQKPEPHGKFVHIAAGAGFGVGTGAQVDPPLNNEQVDDKAFLIEGKLGIGKHAGKHTDWGLLVPITYGYFFKNGVPANMLENHYQGIHVEALLFLRLRVKML